MELLNLRIVPEFVPDIAVVAARSWGVDILCFCLIPLFLSLLVLLVAFFNSISALRGVDAERKPLIIGMVASIFILIATFSLFWYGVVIGRGHALPFLVGISSAVGGGAFFTLWLLLFIVNKGNSFKIKLFLIIALAYALFGFGLVWWTAMNHVKEFLQLGAHSLVFFAVGIIGIYMYKLQERISADDV